MKTWLSLILLCTLAACERPSAPEALGIARRIEQDFANGKMSGVTEMFMRMGSAGWMWGSTKVHRNHALQIRRGRKSSRINGIVMETVIRPPAGFKGQVVERALVGWPDDYAFGLHAHSDSARTGFVIHEPGSEQRWELDAGKLSIGAPQIDGACPTSGELMPHQPSSGVTCELAAFELEFDGSFQRVAAPPLGVVEPGTLLLRLPKQRVRGIRFVIACPTRETLLAGMAQAAQRRETGFAEVECMRTMQSWIPDGVPTPP